MFKSNWKTFNYHIGCTIHHNYVVRSFFRLFARLLTHSLTHSIVWWFSTILCAVCCIEAMAQSVHGIRKQKPQSKKRKSLLLLLLRPKYQIQRMAMHSIIAMQARQFFLTSEREKEKTTTKHTHTHHVISVWSRFDHYTTAESQREWETLLNLIHFLKTVAPNALHSRFLFVVSKTKRLRLYSNWTYASVVCG